MAGSDTLPETADDLDLLTIQTRGTFQLAPIAGSPDPVMAVPSEGTPDGETPDASPAPATPDG